MGEIESKYQALGGPGGMLGQPTAPESEVGRGRCRTYQNGRIYWSAETGAHVVYGAILQRYLTLGGPTGFLGFPMTDEFGGAKAGSRVSRFEDGAVYWHQATGAHEVHGLIFNRYLALNGEAGLLGLPKTDEMAAPGGRKNDFEGGTIFLSSQSGAHEVHGGILERYRALGATSSFLGFPISDEEKIVARTGGDSGGRLSRFQNGTIYWGSTSGAFEVHGYIRERYEKLGGPLGKMGYPLTNETSVAGTGIRYNNFQKGIIVWRGDIGAREITDLRLQIGEVSCGEIDDGIGFLKKDKTPELITNLTVSVNGNVLVNNERRPPDHGGSSRNVGYGYTVSPVRSDTTIYFKVSVDDWDAASSNDYLGRREETFNIRNLWGILGGYPQGIYNDQPAQNKGSSTPSLQTLKFDFSIQPVQPPDPSKHFREQYWWRFDNFKTATLSRDQFAQTYRDVEHVDNWWDKLMSPVDWAIYEAVYKGLASKGNCFGMCLDALYVRAGRSTLIEPLYQYKAAGDKSSVEEPDVPTPIRQEINHYHGYQLGDAAVRWYISRLATLEAVNPIAVYQRVKTFLDMGDYPIVSVFNLDDFKGHAVLPYACVPGSSSQPHKILVADPNVPWRTKPGDASWIEINQANNTFKLVTNGQVTYQSQSALAGLIPTSFLMELPYHVVSSEPRTPFWEVITALTMLLGGLLILVGDAESSQVSSNGHNYYQTDGGKKRVVANALPNFQRIPFLDCEGRAPELYAQVGRLPDKVAQQIKGAANGTYSHYLRNRSTGVELRGPIALNAQDQLNLEAAAGKRPVYHLQTSEAGKVAHVDYCTAIDHEKGDYRRFTADLQLAAGAEAMAGMTEDGEAVVLKPAGPARPLEVTVETRMSGQVKKAKVSYTPPAVGETITIRPVDWNAPVGPMALERFSALHGPSLGRIEVPGQRIDS